MHCHLVQPEMDADAVTIPPPYYYCYYYSMPLNTSNCLYFPFLVYYSLQLLVTLHYCTPPLLM